MGIVKQKVQADDELEIDGEYVPGQDSCKEQDQEIDAKKETRKKQVLKMKEKKVKKATNPIRMPITRSRAVGPSSLQSEYSPHPEIWKSTPPITEPTSPVSPPPLPLPKVVITPTFPLRLTPTKKLTSQGIGSMEAYLIMKDRQKTVQKGKGQVDDGGETVPSQTHEETQIPTGNYSFY